MPVACSDKTTRISWKGKSINVRSCQSLKFRVEMLGGNGGKL